MTRKLDSRLLIALTGLLATAAPLTAQDPDPTAAARKRNAERVAGAKLQLEQRCEWGQDKLPGLPPLGREPVFWRMMFSADGSVLAIKLGDGLYVARLSDSEFVRLEDETAQLVGPIDQTDLVAHIDTELWRFGADGEQQQLPDLKLPERSDGWTSPFASRLLAVSMVRYRVSTHLYDLGTRKRSRLPVGTAHPTAVAWHPDDRRFAIAVAGYGAGPGVEPGEGIFVLTMAGAVQRRFDDRGQTVRALDLSVDGRSLTWADERIRRADIESGEELASAEGRPEFWANVDPVLAVSHDGNSLHLWDGVHLQRIREIPLAEERPDVPAERFRTRGVVLGTAITAKRDRLAVATFEGLRIYRIKP